jgi:hypothetical protein
LNFPFLWVFLFVRILDLFNFQQLVQNFIGVFCWNLGGGVLILPPWGVLFPSYNCGKAIFLFIFSSLGPLGIHGAISEEVTMLMAFPASKGDVFVVDFLVPVLVLIFQSNRSR